MYLELKQIYEKLWYIGSQEAYFAMAPLLLIKTKVTYIEGLEGTNIRHIYKYTVGIDFYNEIAHLFANVSLPKCVNVEYFDLKELYSEGKCKEIEKYIPIVYQWMMDNKGKYEL